MLYLGCASGVGIRLQNKYALRMAIAKRRMEAIARSNDSDGVSSNFGCRWFPNADQSILSEIRSRISCYALECAYDDSLRFICRCGVAFSWAVAAVVLVLTSARMLAFGKFRRMAKTCRAWLRWLSSYVVVSDSGLASYSAEDRQRRPVYCMDI